MTNSTFKNCDCGLSEAAVRKMNLPPNTENTNAVFLSESKIHSAFLELEIHSGIVTIFVLIFFFFF